MSKGTPIDKDLSLSDNPQIIMKNILIVLLLTCVCLFGQAQVNFVKNPSLEQYSICPNGINQINLVNYWSIPGDSTTTLEYCLEYFNKCGNDSIDFTSHVPFNSLFYQNPREGSGMAGSLLFYNKTLPSPPGILPFNYRDNLVGRLYSNLKTGNSYCISFWINLTETSGYAHNKIGAYLDDGTINTMIDTLGEEISNIKAQVFTNEIIKDTGNWTKIEGSFIANGTESYISIGNFFPNDSVSTISMPGPLNQYSYYLIDYVAVIPIDLNADAGKDSHAEPSKPVQIGRVGDTTAQGLDCKWYYKGTLIDSGAIISVNGSTIVGTIDTYVVVQTICGLVKTDTVIVTTVPVGMKEWNIDKTFSVFPNPSNGNITITTAGFKELAQAKIYDLLGRIVKQQNMHFYNSTATLNVDLTSGVYIFELLDDEGNSNRQRIIIE
jgi:hypothetical protein